MATIVHALVWAFMLYLASGFVFAVFFVLYGIERIDSQAPGSSRGFRLIIIPGATALWPLLLSRWLRHAGDPPVESNAHRRMAAPEERR